jgi:hypothetical protein
MRRFFSLATAVAILVGALAFPGAVTASSGSGPGTGTMLSVSILQFGPGYWGVGDHTYSIQYYSTWCTCANETDGPFTFTVDPLAPLYAGNVFLPNQSPDLWGYGIYSEAGPVPSNTINRAQGTFFWAGWTFDMTGASGPPDTIAGIKTFLAESSISYRFDGGPWVLAPQSPITNISAYGFVKKGGGFFHRTW